MCCERGSAVLTFQTILITSDKQNDKKQNKKQGKMKNGKLEFKLENINR